jgi:hypothetical protein
LRGKGIEGREPRRLREIKKLDQRLLTTENNKSRIKHDERRCGYKCCFWEKRDEANSN